MSRARYPRRLPAVVLAGGLALAVSACGDGGTTEGTLSAPSPSATAAQLNPNVNLSKQNLTVSIPPGYTPDDLAARVDEKLRVKLKVLSHDSNAAVMGKLTADGGSDLDVAFVSGQYAQALNKKGLLEPIHSELVPNLANLYPEAEDLAYDKGNAFSVPYIWGTTGICYRSDVLKTPPTSWNDLLSPPEEARGKVTMMTAERWLLLPAVKAIGTSINTKSEDDLVKVKEKLIEAKPNLLGYDDGTYGERLKSGEAVMAEARDGGCPGREKDIKFVLPKEGSDLWVDTMVILRSSKNKEAAHAFINFVLDPKIHAWAARSTSYKVPNKAAMDALSPEVKRGDASLQMSPSQLLAGESLTDLGEDTVRYTRLVTEVKAGK
ncbi:spermidine/putrescine ABC transporter substrate-binding protein [Streptosporangium sp. NPDC051022]|uniref:polyamine ABC transporter substrate-binding protein n=1 Tax=Streptosporangium sp. NPDC051022 TaxID=3155752 RepID=UPI00343573D2